MTNQESLHHRRRHGTVSFLTIVKIKNIQTTENIAVIILKFEQYCFSIQKMCPKDVEEMENRGQYKLS